MNLFIKRVHAVISSPSNKLIIPISHLWNILIMAIVKTKQRSSLTYFYSDYRVYCTIELEILSSSATEIYEKNKKFISFFKGKVVISVSILNKINVYTEEECTC